MQELELRIETQKQTLQARDESIKKLLEMLQNKGMGKEEERQMFQQMQAMAQKQLDEFRLEIQRRDQEIMNMVAKMKTLEEQHQVTYPACKISNLIVPFLFLLRITRDI